MAIQLPYTGVTTNETIPAPYTNGNEAIDLTLKEDKANKGVANGYAPLDANAKIPTANLTLAGVQWTTRHTTSTGNQYVVGSIVYHNGRVYRCLATNDSIEPPNNSYWADLGVGYLLPNENPKILGGSIDISAGAVTQRSYQVETGNEEDPFETENETSFAGGSNGNIILKGGNGGFDTLGGGVGGNAGSINTSGGIGSDARGGNGGSILLVGGVDTADAGSINLSGGTSVGNGGSIISTGANGDNYNGGTLNMSADSSGNGGSINTSNKGGSINTSGYDANAGGSINLSAGLGGAGGYIDGKNKGGFIKFYGTGSNLENGGVGGAGGSINISAGRHSQTGQSINPSTGAGLGGNGGSIQLLGGSGGEENNGANGGNGGTILGDGGGAITVGQNAQGEAILATGYNAGTINFSAGYNGAGGNINISDGGGSINTRGTGSIELGVTGTRTTLNGSASGSNKTITLPNATGTIALTNDTRLSRPYTFRTLFATTSVASASDTRYFSTIDAVGPVSGLELRNFQLPYDFKVVACSATIYNTSASALASGGTVAFNLVTKSAQTSTSANQTHLLLSNWTLGIAATGMVSNYNASRDISISAGTNLAVQVVFTNLTGASLRGELTLYTV